MTAHVKLRTAAVLCSAEICSVRASSAAPRHKPSSVACAASFRFNQPSVFEAGNELGEITGLYMLDEEGEISSVDVNAKFVNGKPATIEVKHVMRSPLEWDRFMRFMERYAAENNLGFSGVRSRRCSTLNRVAFTHAFQRSREAAACTASGWFIFGTFFPMPQPSMD